jgi:ABC-type hemin transport system ATPase subunit
VADHADRVLVLQAGRVVFAGEPSGYEAAAAEVFG